MAFTKINAAGIGTTETVTVDGLTVINDGSFGGNLSVGGTITYEDVTNVDSVGLITARNGIVVGSGITLSKDGDVFFTGIATGNGSGLTNLPSAQLTGALPALDGSALTGVASTDNIRTNTNATFLKNVNVSGTATVGGVILGDGSDGDGSLNRLKFGADGDLQIYHNQYHSKIVDGGTGSLIISGSEIKFEVEPSSTERLRIEQAGNVNISKNLSVTGVTTSQTFVPSEGQLANRNLIINGAMRVAQRGTSYTGGYSAYYKTVDRQFVYAGGLPNTDVTTSQINITTGSPYDAGFRKAFQIQMGYQGSTPTDVQVAYSYRMEAQDLACSGWKHTSSSSYLTLSFWVRSSVAQTFYGQLRTIDGTNYHYPFSYALSADTWTKVEKTIPGNSNLTLNNDNGEGLRIDLTPYYGTDYTNNSVSLNAWGTHSNSAKTPDQTATWYQTNGATWQITGLQLEVGQNATPFEHRSFGEELSLCQRYYEVVAAGMIDTNESSGYLGVTVQYASAKRAVPTITRLSDDQVNSVATPFSEFVTINGFRAVANVTGGGAKFQTVYSIASEL